MPTFGPKAIQDMFGNMLDIAEQLCVKWERMGSSNVIDIVDNMTRLTLDKIALCAFDYRFNSFYQVEMHPFVNAMVEALSEAGNKSLKLRIQDKLSIRANRKYRENISLMHTTADELISERKKHPNDTNDLLNRMLNGRDPVTNQGLSDENIRYQMVTFLIAGHETTSGLLSFALYELMKHPDCLQKAQQEVDEVIGTEQISVKHLPKLTYLDQVLKETLRLWPTAPAFALRCDREQVIAEKYTIHPTDTVLVLAPQLQRDPVVWGDDAEEFRPERVCPEKFASLPKNSWKPFGNGARACIGRPFAWQEALLVLAMILQRFDLVEHDPNYKMKIKETLTIKPEGLFLRVNVRKSWEKRSKSANITSQKTTATDYAEVDSDASTDVDSNKPLLILFGSNSGTCESFANTLSISATNRGYQPTIAHLNSYAGHLPLDKPIVIVTASYEGEPTDDAKQFVTWLTHVPDQALKGVKYAVMGCGHSDWASTYQRVPTYIDDRMNEAGAERIVARGEANAAQDMISDFDNWCDAFWKTMSPNHNVNDSKKPQVSSIGVDVIKGSRDTILRMKNMQQGTVLENKELVNDKTLDSNGATHSKRHIEVLLPDKMQYKSGDYLAVLPVNSMTVVNKALRQFNLNYDDEVVLQKTEASHSLLAFPTDKLVSVVELFMNYFELSLPASKRQLETISEATEDAGEKQKILDLGLANNKLSIPSVLDILDEFKSCKITLGTFLEMSVPMRLRQYSISSSPLWSPNKCTITVGVLNVPSKCGKGMHEGVASNFLSHCLPGMKISMMVRSSTFKLPEDPTVPIIMVGAGTGIAPLRGFLQERSYLKKNGQALGAALLFQGCRTPDEDYIYKEELEEWSGQGVVQLRPVFSRVENHNGVKYVQHRIWECRQEVAELLSKDAHIFVCGEAGSMAPAVKQVFVDIFRESTNCTQEEAERRMSSMDSRYSVDVFA